MIPQNILDQIQERLDIVEVISSYMPLRQAGRNFKACCPFHQEKTPSFVVNPDKQIFHCFGCGEGGNIFSFVMKKEKKDFREAAETLAERVGVEIPSDKNNNSELMKRTTLYGKANQTAANYYHRNLLFGSGSDGARDYLKKRGITSETIAEFKLGFAPDAWDEFYATVKAQIADEVLEKIGLVIRRREGGYYDRFRNRIIFPILDARGTCVAFGGRVLNDELPKYLNSPESEFYFKGKNLYGLTHAKTAIRQSDFAIIVEGYMDLIACHQVGVKNVVASLGTALTVDQARLLKRQTKNVLILYDADKAGETATLRGLEILLQEALEVKIVRLPKGHDPDSYIRECGRDKFTQALAAAQTLFDYRLALLKSQYDIKTVEGKVKVANEMLGLFLKAQNEILRSAWIKELSTQLQLSEQALNAQLLKGQKVRIENFQSRASVVASSLPAKREIMPAERLLLGLFLDRPEYVAETKQALEWNDFQNEKIRDIAKFIFESEGSFVTASQLVNVYKEDPDSVKIVSMACSEAESVENKEKTLKDCLLWMKKSRITTQRENLRSQILMAQHEGDRNRVSRLLGDLEQLNKGIKEIYEKK